MHIHIYVHIYMYGLGTIWASEVWKALRVTSRALEGTGRQHLKRGRYWETIWGLGRVGRHFEGTKRHWEASSEAYSLAGIRRRHFQLWIALGYTIRQGGIRKHHLILKRHQEAIQGHWEAWEVSRGTIWGLGGSWKHHLRLGSSISGNKLDACASHFKYLMRSGPHW